jgi:hypothetical protein
MNTAPQLTSRLAAQKPYDADFSPPIGMSSKLPNTDRVAMICRDLCEFNQLR